MPPIGLLLGRVDFSKLEWVLAPEDPATEAIEEVAIQYGAFINTLIQFVIVAFVVFLMVKVINQAAPRGGRRARAAPAAPTADRGPAGRDPRRAEGEEIASRRKTAFPDLSDP